MLLFGEWNLLLHVCSSQPLHILTKISLFLEVRCYRHNFIARYHTNNVHINYSSN